MSIENDTFVLCEIKKVMTEDQKNARREFLYGKSVRELVEMIIQAEEELMEAKDLRRRLMQIRNLVLEKEERRKPGRPHKGQN